MEEKGKISEVGGINSGYRFEFKSDGVYLTIYPSEGGERLFELSDMRQILGEYGVTDYDSELLARVVRSADGEAHHLAAHYVLPASSSAPAPKSAGDSKAEEEKEREPMRFSVQVSKDRMTATIHIDRDMAKKLPSEDEILKALEEQHITFGIDRDAIRSGLAYSAEIIAAKGNPVQNGTDAQIVRKFTMADKGRPAVNQYDQVDYKNMNLFVLAKEGQVLVERIPQTPGVPGTNVYGDEVRPQPGRPKPLPTGKNTEVRDENFLVSLIDGQIIDSESKVSVDPKLLIKGDVGVGTGDIDFIGAVDVGGGVQQGFVLKATGDINIRGTVSGGTVEGCNVYISGGVQGLNRGSIRAENDVRAVFAENATIEAGGSIFITDVALHSELRAGTAVIVEGRRGLVTGGYLAAGQEIRAKTIGNPSYVATKLVVGVNPMLQKKYQETCKEYAANKKRLAQLTKSLNTLGKIDVSKLSPARAEQVNKLRRAQFPLAGQIERAEKLIREIEEQIAQMHAGRIRVADKMYPGTKLSINSILKNIMTEEQHCTLAVEGDEIKSAPY